MDLTSENITSIIDGLWLLSVIGIVCWAAIAFKKHEVKSKIAETEAETAIDIAKINHDIELTDIMFTALNKIADGSEHIDGTDDASLAREALYRVRHLNDKNL